MPQIVSKTISLYPFCILERQPAYLALRRAPDGKLAGAWQVVHGHLKKNETCARAAIRELLEETRLEPHALWSLDYVETVFVSRTDTVRIVPCFAALVSGKLKLSKEHDEARWLSYADAAQTYTFRSQREALQVVHEELALEVASGGNPAPLLRVV